MSELTYKQPHIATQIDKATQKRSRTPTTNHSPNHVPHGWNHTQHLACKYVTSIPPITGNGMV